MLMIIWKTRTLIGDVMCSEDKKITAVKVFNRMIKMSCRFSLHCIVTVT